MLFDFIAPVYSLFFKYQVKKYKRDFDIIKKNNILKDSYNTILDVGSGTGALCHVLYEEEFNVTGTEISKGMFRSASRKLSGKDIKLLMGDVLKGLPFDDKSFDIVITSFVAHGLTRERRIVMYKEMARLAKRLVILVDYNQNRSIITNIAETLEGGDYFNFIESIDTELNEMFIDVRKIDTGILSSWYICRPN